MDTEDIDYCTECGIYYNKSIVLKESEDSSCYDPSYVGKCPNCEKEVMG